jgi:hypothetical protein
MKDKLELQKRADDLFLRLYFAKKEAEKEFIFTSDDSEKTEINELIKRLLSVKSLIQTI